MVKVDWNKFVELSLYREDTPSEKKYSEKCSKLLAEGIFGFSKGYELSYNGISINPRHPALWRPILYFKKEKDALDYKEAQFKDALYYNDIKLSKFIDKPEKSRRGRKPKNGEKTE